MAPRAPSDDEQCFFEDVYWSGDDVVDVSVKKDGGILKRVLTASTGKCSERPSKHCKVYVDYRGWNYVGASMFDESRTPDGSGAEFAFDLGKGMVIGGWDEGVATMAVGEVAVFKLAPAYGYGPGGSPPKIPASSVLIFKVTLNSYSGEDISPKSNKSIERFIVSEGEAYLTPVDDTLVTVNVVGKRVSDDVEFMNESALQFLVGECTEARLPPGVDKAILRINKGEQCRLVLSDEWTYADAPLPNIIAGQPVALLVTLTAFDKVRNSWEMDFEEKVRNAEAAKEKGTQFFKEGKYALALRRYKQIDGLLQFEQSSGNEHIDAKKKALLLSGHLNEAMTYLKTDEPLEAIKQCNVALKQDDCNVKALYRRAMGYQQMKELAKAVVDLDKVLSLEDSNAAARAKLVECKHELSEDRRKEKQLYAKMFSA